MSTVIRPALTACGEKSGQRWSEFDATPAVSVSGPELIGNHFLPTSCRPKKVLKLAWTMHRPRIGCITPAGVFPNCVPAALERAIQTSAAFPVPTQGIGGEWVFKLGWRNFNILWDNVNRSASKLLYKHAVLSLFYYIHGRAPFHFTFIVWIVHKAMLILTISLFSLQMRVHAGGRTVAGVGSVWSGM